MKPLYARAKTNLLSSKVQAVCAANSTDFLFSPISITSNKQGYNIDNY
jgi:hypothetical protein